LTSKDRELTYAKGITASGDAIGLTDDYELSPQLARFLAINETIVDPLVSQLEHALVRYREKHWKECQAKMETMSYRFLSFVYDRPLHPAGLAESSIEYERNLILRQLMVGSEDIFKLSYDRLAAVTGSKIATWWYIFWVRTLWTST
jgi:hypothetical protein